MLLWGSPSKEVLSNLIWALGTSMDGKSSAVLHAHSSTAAPTSAQPRVGQRCVGPFFPLLTYHSTTLYFKRYLMSLEIYSKLEKKYKS